MHNPVEFSKKMQGYYRSFMWLGEVALYTRCDSVLTHFSFTLLSETKVREGSPTLLLSAYRNSAPVFTKVARHLLIALPSAFNSAPVARWLSKVVGVARP